MLSSLKSCLSYSFFSIIHFPLSIEHSTHHSVSSCCLTVSLTMVSSLHFTHHYILQFLYHQSILLHLTGHKSYVFTTLIVKAQISVEKIEQSCLHFKFQEDIHPYKITIVSFQSSKHRTFHSFGCYSNISLFSCDVCVASSCSL